MPTSGAPISESWHANFVGEIRRVEPQLDATCQPISATVPLGHMPSHVHRDINWNKDSTDIHPFLRHYFPHNSSRLLDSLQPTNGRNNRQLLTPQLFIYTNTRTRPLHQPLDTSTHYCVPFFVTVLVLLLLFIITIINYYIGILYLLRI